MHELDALLFQSLEFGFSTSLLFVDIRLFRRFHCCGFVLTTVATRSDSVWSPALGRFEVVFFLFKISEVVGLIWQHLYVVKITQVLRASKVFSSFFSGFALCLVVRLSARLHQSSNFVISGARTGIDRRLDSTLLLFNNLTPREQVVLDALLPRSLHSGFDLVDALFLPLQIHIQRHRRRVLPALLQRDQFLA